MTTQVKTLYRLAEKEPKLISLMLLSAFAVMGAIIMTPALPKIADHFSKSVGVTQLAVTSFLLGYAIGQLIYGPLANRFGRKPALYVGIVIASLGSIFSILSSPTNSFSLLILGRFLEAIGSSAGLAVSFTIINDFYFEKDARKITAALMLAFAIVPGVAIAAGGLLVQFLNWRACFYFLLLYGFFLLYYVSTLPETLQKKDMSATQSRAILHNYKEKFCNKKLIGFAMLSGFSSACVYVFGAEGPFIGIHILHVLPAIYGLLGLTPYIGTLLGSIIAMRIAELNPITILKSAFFIELFASLIMLILFLGHHVSLWTLLIPMGIFCIGHPIMSSTGISLSMQQNPDKANTSAVMNFAAMSMPVVMTLLLSEMHIGAPWILPVVMLIALMLMCATYQLIRE
ncbi:MAG: hypothetical protein A3E81_01360 [Gammaproteobacteria bacterium RIFCSPHIGHO2_12_FULL_36_30]|nr:MAG: hypothetical protein A3E81_01360 [Gammaproteobacteria bacterium RIFCSPHIGHO2_12_FULL_36_30]